MEFYYYFFFLSVVINFKAFLTFQSLNCSDVKISNAVWLIGETPVTGLSNQLSAVYSYIPVALLLNATLVTREMYSRKNFEVRMRQYDQDKDGKTVMSFATFFDLTWFASYWEGKGVRVYLFERFTYCLLRDKNIRDINEFLMRKTKFIQRKKWRSASYPELISMINSSQLVFPITKGTIVRFKSKFKMMSLFDFRSLSSNSLLLQVHESIRPNRAVLNVAEKVIRFLPNEYIVMHLRIEGDVIFKFNNYNKSMQFGQMKDPEFFKQLPLIISAVKQSRCMKDISNFTTVYVASGAFNGEENSYSKQRELLIRSSLHDLGFNNIYSRANIVSNVTDPLPAELGAYVDLQVARRGGCFVPAHVPSSFSYTVQRMKELDSGITETQIVAPNRRYSHYFF